MSSLEYKEAKAREHKEKEKYATEATASHSREKIQLCHEIILCHFGSVAARVAAVLLQRGRLTLRELSRFLNTSTVHVASGLMQDQEEDMQGEVMGGPSTSATTSGAPLKSQRLIQQTLLTLIQHNICWHACVMSDGQLALPGSGDSTRGIEYFQINVDEVLPRLRFGAYLALAEERFGTEGFDIVNELLKNGKLRAEDVESRLNLEGDKDRAERIRVLLRNLLYSAYIKPSLPKMHTSPRDRRISYEAASLRSMKKMLTPKQRVDIAADAGRRLESDEKDVWKDESTGMVGGRRGLIIARKRKAPNGKGRKNLRAPSKKAKTSNGRGKSSNLAISSDSEGEDEEREKYDVDPGLFIRVNFDRFDVHIRDDIIYKAVEHRYNTTTAEVLQAMMRMNVKISVDIPSTKDEQSAVLHIANIRQHLPPGIALKKAFDRDSLRSALGSDPAQSSLLAEVIMILLGAGDISRAGLSRRLVTPGGIANGSVIGAGASQTPTQLHVQFGNAARVLREQLLRNVVEAQFGGSGTRIMSLLRDMGKLEEKHISKLTLMPMGETRDVCSRLFAASLLSLQEVPKSSDRSAARTIFFWYVNEKKCTAWLCDHLFKTLSRLSQRRRHELVKEADLIAKSQRIDVAQDHSLMNDIERRRLQKVQDTVALIALAEQRTWQDLFVVLQLPE